MALTPYSPDDELYSDLDYFLSLAVNTQGLDALTEPEKNIYHVLRADGTIGNGGIEYFYEGKGDAVATAASFEAIGLHDAASAMLESRTVVDWTQMHTCYDFDPDDNEDVEEEDEIPDDVREALDTISRRIWNADKSGAAVRYYHDHHDQFRNMRVADIYYAVGPEVTSLQSLSAPEAAILTAGWPITHMSGFEEYFKNFTNASDVEAALRLVGAIESSAAWQRASRVMPEVILGDLQAQRRFIDANWLRYHEAIEPIGDEWNASITSLRASIRNYAVTNASSIMHFDLDEVRLDIYPPDAE
jgi:hypothetical protein